MFSIVILYTSNDIKDGDNNNNTNETMKKKFFSWRSDSF